MKKIIKSILFILLFFCCFTACKTQPIEENPKNPDVPKGDSDMNNPPIIVKSNILITYFSCTNTTKTIAEYIQKETNGTLYEIIPQIPYTAEDLTYYTNCRADKEQSDSSVRPAINGTIENMDSYDTIFLGYPIWHGQAPRIISTFLESYTFSNKTIIPFCTSHSSGIGSSDKDLYSLAKEANWNSGKRFSSTTSQKDISNWITTLNLNLTHNVSSFDLEKGINGCAPTVQLNSGYKMPILGLGTYSLQKDICKSSVLSALSQGYRLIDTAHMYGNEQEIGEAIRESGIPREEIFVITKIYPGEQFSNPEKAIQESLEKLNIDYIDMMLLHHPGANDVKAYKAIESYVKQGKIRSIGLSNWYIEEIDDFISQISIIPALIQNEIHPYYQEQSVVPYMHKLGIVMQAWYPLGGRGHTSELLADNTITRIAKKHGKTSAQIILRWHLQRGIVAIPGSSNPDHILENISIFDFELSDTEMTEIASLNRNEKHDWY
ncbi:MAG: aldo/keto reductase [Anaeroplasmataceae bacterium]|nr:aldo/keto reductase [Anaeroplasmataceae bacterium]